MTTTMGSSATSTASTPTKYLNRFVNWFDLVRAAAPRGQNIIYREPTPITPTLSLANAMMARR